MIKFKKRTVQQMPKYAQQQQVIFESKKKIAKVFNKLNIKNETK